MAPSDYTSLESLYRLRALQGLCAEKSDGSDGAVDALLVIGGIDGDNHVGSEMIIKYLLLGQSGSELLDSKLGVHMEDAAMVITRKGVGLYCNHHVAAQIAPSITLWRGLTTHVLSKEEMLDADAAEEFKVVSFISLATQGCKRFGIAPGGSSKPGSGAGSVVEGWPLVQAFALEQIDGGSRGFFTMNFGVVDITARLFSLCLGRVDPRSNVAWLHGHCAPEMARHVKELMEQLDSASATDRLEMLEADLAEPVTSYYEYALIRERMKTSGSVGRGSRWAAQVRVGSRSDGVGEELSADDANGEVQIAQCSSDPAGPAHFVVAASQAHGPLYAARTYFLQSVSSDALFLRRLYTAIVAATHKALGMVAEDCVLDELSAVDVHDAVYVSVEAAVNQVGLPPDYETKEHLDVEVVAVDALGKADPAWRAPLDRDVPLCSSNTPGMTPSVRVVRCRLRHIPTQGTTADLSGSLVVADSFMFGSVGGKGTVRILTAQVPYVGVWLSKAEEALATQVKRDISEVSDSPVAASLGSRLLGKAGGQFDDDAPVTLDECPLLLSGVCDYMQVITGAVQAWSKGIVISHRRLGHLVLTFASVLKVSVLEISSGAAMSLLVLYLDPSVDVFGMERPKSGGEAIVGIIVKGGKSVVFRDVLPVWKEQWHESGMTVDAIEAPPASLALAFANVGAPFDCTQLGSELTADPSGTGPADRSVFVNCTSLQDFTSGHVSAETFEVQTVGRVPLFVVCGVPGSRHGVVARSLESFGAAVGDWTVMRQQSDEVDLSELAAAAQQAAKSPRPRLMFITEGYIDIVNLSGTIVTHKELASLCFIANVVAVVNPSNISIERKGQVAPKFASDVEQQFSDKSAVLPLLLDQCAWGWAGAIVILGGSAKVQNEMQQRLSKVNPDAMVVRAAYTMLWEIGDADQDRKRAAEACLGMLSRAELDALLSTETFYAESMRRVRTSIAPEWPLQLRHVTASDVPEQLAFQWRPVLDRDRLLRSMQSLLAFSPDSSWCQPPPRVLYARVIAHTCDSAGRFADMSFTAAQSDVTLRAEGDVSSGGMVQLYGENLGASVQWLKRRFLDCRPVLPSRPKTIASFEELAPEQLQAIAEAAQLDSRALPDGCFYDGKHYVSFEGASSKWHPAMAQLCAGAVAQHNEHIVAEQAVVDEQHRTAQLETDVCLAAPK